LQLFLSFTVFQIGRWFDYSLILLQAQSLNEISGALDVRSLTLIIKEQEAKIKDLESGIKAQEAKVKKLENELRSKNAR
jgi:homogentisate solanesyltransferase